MKNVFSILVLLSVLSVPFVWADDERPTGSTSQESEYPTSKIDQSSTSTSDEGAEIVVEAPKSCTAPFANQILSLRTAQLNIRHPDNGRTLNQLKTEHDKKVAQLILLKGLQQIRKSYLDSLERHNADLSKKIKSLQDLKDFAVSNEGDIKATERMLIMEKGISQLGNIQAKSKEEFYNQMIDSCKTLKDGGVTPATTNICASMADPKHQEMIFGFYNAYVKTDQTAEERENYLSYLKMVANENRLNAQLGSLTTLHNKIEATSKKFVRCTETKGDDCQLFDGEASAAYNEYRATLYSTPVIENSNQTSLVLDHNDQTKIQVLFNSADEKIAEVKAFFDDIKLGDQQITSDLNSTDLLEGLNKKLADFEKKTKHGTKDYSDILKAMRCKGDIFVGDADESKEKEFNKCIKNISDKVLDAKIADLAKEIEGKRKEISSITTAPWWWENTSKKMANQKYIDLSTAINEVINTMQRDCKLDSLKREDTYVLQACGINDFMPPEQAQNLSLDVERILDGMQISSVHDENAIKDICSRIRDYGTSPPAAICYGGYDGKSAPSEQLAANAPDKPSHSTSSGSGGKSSTDSAQLSSSGPSGGSGGGSVGGSSERTRRLANGLSPTRQTQKQARSSSFSAGDYAKAFAKAVSNSQATMSTLTMWAQSPMFSTQLGWQVDMAKQQMNAEAYQKAWLDYYTQAQQNSWLNFMGSSQGVPLYNGGVYYNFSNTTTTTTTN